MSVHRGWPAAWLTRTCSCRSRPRRRPPPAQPGGQRTPLQGCCGKWGRAPNHGLCVGAERAGCGWFWIVAIPGIDSPSIRGALVKALGDQRGRDYEDRRGHLNNRTMVPKATVKAGLQGPFRPRARPPLPGPSLGNSCGGLQAARGHSRQLYL